MRIIKTCILCEVSFSFRNAPSDIKAGGGKYCTKKCRNDNMSKVLKEKGIKPKVHYVAHGKENYNWKGDKVGYWGIHKWVARHKGTPSKCEFCKTTTAKKYEWANISKEYKRDLTDWVRLCVSCHQNWDGSRYTMWETRRKTTIYSAVRK